jgi:hypothetical protein
MVSKKLFSKLLVECRDGFGGWVDGWMDEWMNGWMDGWMDGWMELAVYDINVKTLFFSKIKNFYSIS